MKKMLALVSVAALAVTPLVLAQEGGAPPPKPGPGVERGQRGGGRGPGGGQMQERMKEAWAAVDKEACFKTMDANGDGTVSKEEFQKTDLQEVFGTALRDAMRKDAPGGEGPGGGDPAAAFKRMDKNGDGKIAVDEFPRGAEAFNKLKEHADKDGDGLLSEEEFKAAHERMARNRDRRGKE